MTYYLLLFISLNENLRPTRGRMRRWFDRTLLLML